MAPRRASWAWAPAAVSTRARAAAARARHGAFMEDLRSLHCELTRDGAAGQRLPCAGPPEFHYAVRPGADAGSEEHTMRARMCVRAAPAALLILGPAVSVRAQEEPPKKDEPAKAPGAPAKQIARA